MQLSLTEDQAMLAKTASSFFAGQGPVSRLRALRNAHDERGYTPAVWQQIAGLGWTAIPFAEDVGGAGMGLAGAVIVTEALGRGLAPEPYVASVVLAGQILARAGNEAQRTQWLDPLIAGDKVIAVAYQEAGSRYDVKRVQARAERTANGFKLSGDKQQVLAGFGADAFIVSARTDSGIALFLVPASERGVKTTRQWRVDSKNAALVSFDNVELPRSALIGGEDKGVSVLSDAIDRASVALCGEMLGAMSEAFDRTIAYLKERKQFGVAIGTFQALKHRAAKMFIELELARSAVLAAARAIDEAGTENKEVALTVSAAKARCSDAYVLIANEAVQMHGGIGMTDEHDIGLFMKHARACELTFGDAAFHRERYAELSGY